ncbi:MAG: OmpH family outer membrane protein [Neptuniibacter sp.]
MRALLGFILTLGISFSASAQNIAVVDIQAALLTSTAAKQYQQSLKAEFAKEQQAVVDLEKQVKAARDKAAKNKDLVSADELNKMKMQFQKVFAEYQRAGQALQQKKMQREQAFLQQMRPQLDQALKAVIAEGGYDLVLSRQAAHYSDKKYDITQKVVELLNKQ